MTPLGLLADAKLRIPPADPQKTHTRYVATRALTSTCSTRVTWRRRGSHDLGREEHSLTAGDTAVFSDTGGELGAAIRSLHNVQGLGTPSVRPGDSLKVMASPKTWQVMTVEETRPDGIVARNHSSVCWLEVSTYGRTWIRTVETKPAESQVSDPYGDGSQDADSFTSRWTIPAGEFDWQTMLENGAQCADGVVSREYDNAMMSLQTLARFLGASERTAAHKVQRLAAEMRAKYEPPAVLFDRALREYGPYVRNMDYNRRAAAEKVWSQSVVGARWFTVHSDIVALQSALEAAA